MTAIEIVCVIGGLGLFCLTTLVAVIFWSYLFPSAEDAHESALVDAIREQCRREEESRRDRLRVERYRALRDAWRQKARR